MKKKKKNKNKKKKRKKKMKKKKKKNLRVIISTYHINKTHGPFLLFFILVYKFLNYVHVNPNINTKNY